MKVLVSLFFIFLTYNLNAGINYNWWWGVQRLNSANSFVINFLPEFSFYKIKLKLELPVEFRSNYKISGDYWNSEDDILQKIEYVKFNINKNINLNISPLRNITFGNGILMFNFSDYIFYPQKKNIGCLLNTDYKYLKSRLIVDNISDLDFIGIDINYKINRYNAAIQYFYNDNNIYNILFNYKLINNNKSRLYLENNLISVISATNIVNFISGIRFVNNYLNLYLKFNYPLLSDNIINSFDVMYLYDKDIYDRDMYSILSGAEINFFNIFTITADYNVLNKVLFFKFKTGKEFFSIINIEAMIFNKGITDWADIFGDRDKNTVMELKFSAPLSENLFLNFDYLKHFTLTQEGLRVLRFYTEFKF